MAYTIEKNSSAKQSRVKMRRDLGPSIILLNPKKGGNETILSFVS